MFKSRQALGLYASVLLLWVVAAAFGACVSGDATVVEPGETPGTCTSDGDCAADDTDCLKHTCQQGGCVGVNEPSGASCDDDDGVLCNGEGRCVECLLDPDCGGDVCNASGVCVPPACDDSLLNGEETDTDCGGPDCPDCGNGSVCVEDADCQSNFCDDGGGSGGSGGSSGSGGFGGASGSGGSSGTSGSGGSGGASGSGGSGGAGGGAPTLGHCAACASEADCDPYVCDQGVCLSQCEADVDCASTNWCDGTLCSPLKDAGGGCGGDNECQSGFCADGVCCDAPCLGDCEACDTLPGTCTPYAQGAPGDGNPPSCSPYLCDGVAGDCPASCSEDADCAANNYCGNGTCQPHKTTGATCAAAGECASDNCVDGRCCNTGCVNACDACNVSGSLGTCVPKLDGTPGDPGCDPYLCNGASVSCPGSCVTEADCTSGNYCSSSNQCQAKKPNGSTCALANECEGALCVDGTCCDSACTASCDACNVAGSEGTCGVVPQGTLGSPTCSPYVCDGASTTCPASCAGNGDCVAGSFCDGNGQCATQLPQGSPCNNGSQCQNGNCVDGYCCNSTCLGSCDACNVAGSLGTCTPVPDGSAGSPVCSPYLCNGITSNCPSACITSTNCASGYYCGANQCVPKKTNGQTCGAAVECQSGSCVDGYCCNTPCSGACDACNLLGTEGSCSLRPDGATGSPSCAPYVCDGASATCPGGCSDDASCGSGFYCDAGTCVATKPNSSPCATASECQSAKCVDGYCCNSGCSGACDACNLAGNLGSCSAVPDGSAGSPACSPYLCDGVISTCPGSCVTSADCAGGFWCDGLNLCAAKKTNGSACGVSVECQSDQCIDGYCCDTACGGSCDQCNLAGFLGTCSTSPAGSAGGPTCSPYVCDGGSTACPSTCTSDANCGASYYCNGTNCVAKKPIGQTCSGASQCQSGNCADGYCCNTACGGSCDACNVSGSFGTCTLLADGASGSPSCSPYLCDGAIASCPNACVTGADCASSHYCDSLNSCVAKKANGSTCAGASECTSGFCADGICCNNACGASCDSCNISGSLGTCTVANDGAPGTPSCSPYLCDGASTTCPATCVDDTDCSSGTFCDGSNHCAGLKSNGGTCSLGNECQSGNCADGVCCNTGCVNACDACNLPGSEGTCTPTSDGSSGSPSCSPYLCDGATTTCPSSCVTSVDCVGTHYCNSINQCAAKKSNGSFCSTSSECTSGFCVDGYCCNAACGASCDACNVSGSLGSCTVTPDGSAGSPSCAPYLCDGASASCPSSCSTAADCSITYYCSSGTCVEKQPNGTTCSTSSQCQSGSCADGYCCNTACGASCDACNLSGSLGTCTVSAAGSSGAPLCAPYVCNGSTTGCPSSCSSDASCVSTHYCGGTTCVPKKSNGTTCSGSNECSSSNCVDGYCCDSTCAGSCDACNISGSLGTCTVSADGSPGDPNCSPNLCDGVGTNCPGTCVSNADCVTTHYCDSSNECTAKKPTGSSCSASNECTSGFCADGYCCNTACGASCDACNISGSIGACTPTPGGSAGTPSCSPYLCNGVGASCPTSCASSGDCVITHYCDSLSTCASKKSNGATCGGSVECQSGFCVDGYCCTSGCGGACDACNISGSLGACTPTPDGSAGSPSCSPYLCDGVSANCPSSCGSDTDCATTHYCSAGVCASKKSNGSTCGASNECGSGNCVDGYCCNTACGSACNACNIAGSLGSCSLMSAGSAGSPTCSPYVCDGASALCPGSCTSDISCASGYYCGGSTCLAKKSNGATCAGSSECSSGFCVDGYCCNNGCGGACDACNLAGTLGTCTLTTAGSPGNPSCSPYVCGGASASCPSTCASNANCASSHYCSSGVCVSKKSNGTACGAAAECGSGNCVDGYCCNTACGGSCDACNIAGSLGTCALVSAGSAGSPSCSPYVCNGASASCPVSCTSDNTCANGYYCNGTSCVAKKANGQTCGGSNQCTSGFCVDGYCCNGGCGGACDACNLSGNLGTCTLSPTGSAGSPSCTPYVCSGASANCPSTCGTDANCASGNFCSGGSCTAKKANGQTCSTTNECLSGFCADGYCCNAGCGGACDACNISGSLGTCTLMSSGSTGSPSCAPYVCSGAGASCPGTCSTDANCASTHYCSSNACIIKKSNGSTCSGGNQCQSGNCIDGYCCNSACGGSCDACNVSGSLGSCSVVTAGSGGSPTCTPYLCDGTSASCPASCTTSSDCVATHYCTGGSCVTKKANSSTCSAGTECQSGNCIDGYCCNSACGGSCQRCNIAGSLGSCTVSPDGDPGNPNCSPYLCNGASTTCPSSCIDNSDCSSGNTCSGGLCTGLKVNGSACSAGSECQSGFCVDGVCCNSACSASCDRCNVSGSVGSCTMSPTGDPGNPICSPYLCSGSSASCPGTCASDANCVGTHYCSGGLCISKKSNGTTCGGNNQCQSGFCVDGYCCNSGCGSSCDACNVSGNLGTCTLVAAGSAGAPTCSPYVCDGSNAGCPSSCSGDSSCSSGFYCSGGVCVSKKSNGTTCSASNQCQSGNCIDGYCCNTSCGGACDACNLSGFLGACTLMSAGSPGSPSCSPYLCSGSSATCPGTCATDANCASTHYCTGGACVIKKTNGLTCTGGNQCASSFCVDGYCCNTSCGSSCDACNVSGSLGSCTIVAAGSAGAPACSPYVCNGSNAGCPGSCTNDSNCASGYYCSGGQCVVKQANGATCSGNNQCTSGNCVDGYCCNSACSGSCNACNLSGNLGACTLMSAGTAGNPTCSPYVCSGSSATCPGTCATDANCASTHYCSGNTCISKKANGTTCTGGNQCASGFCVDGYCCNTGCSSSCNACNVSGSLGSCTVVAAGSPGSPPCSPYVCDGSNAGCPSSCTGDGSCTSGYFCDGGLCVTKRSNGSTCSGNNQCQSSNCIDGYCCNSACGGSCDACNLAGNLGTCTFMSAGSAGNPSCSPYLCSGSSATCPGTCSTDANCASTHYCSGGACISKKSNGSTCSGANQCQSGNCVDGYCCNTACSAGCDACNVSGSLGSCTVVAAGSAGSPTCSPYVCDGSNAPCPGACTGDANCASGYYCGGTACVAKSPNGATCSASNQCQSGNCIDGYCCNAACGSSCDACNIAGNLGTCTLMADGAAGSPSCTPYVCNGVSAFCPTSCIDDTDCAGGATCLGGVCSSCPTPPIVIPPGAPSVSGNTCGQGNNYMPSCVSSTATDVIYAYTAQNTGTVTFSTCGGASWDTALHARAVCSSAASEVACNDDACGLQSTISFAVTAGNTYYVIVDGYSANCGAYTMTITHPGGGDCCGGSCEHNAGYGYSYSDCVDPGTYNQVQAMKACEAVSGAGNCSGYNGCNSSLVCSGGASNCICWGYAGPSAGFAYDGPGMACGCLSGGDTPWN